MSVIVKKCIRGLVRWTQLGLILSLFHLIPFAQVDSEVDKKLDLNEIKQIRKQIEENPGLQAEIQNRLMDLYNQTIGDLESARQHSDRLKSYNREESGIAKSVELISREVQRLQSAAAPELPEFRSIEQVENRLTREQARLASLRVALRESEQLSEQRVKRRNEISRSLGTLDQELSTLNDNVVSVSESDSSTELAIASATRISARREALMYERLALRGELELLEARAVLLPWRRDLAELRVRISEDLVYSLEANLAVLRQEYSNTSLETVRKEAVQVVKALPNLEEIADDTVSYAEMLWGSSGIIGESAAADRELTETRKYQTELERLSQLTRRRFEAVGHYGDITQWWPNIPKDFPRIPEVSRLIRDRETLLPNIQHQLIQLEQERAGFREFERSLISEVEPGESRRILAKLLYTRRELLDDLIDYYGRYSSRLFELVTVQQNFLSEAEKTSAFLTEKALWVRSVPDSSLPRLDVLFEGLIWVLSPETWIDAFEPLLQKIGTMSPKTIGVILALILLVLIRKKVIQRMESITHRASDQNTHIKDSFECLTLTLILALPVPLLLYIIGTILVDSNASSLSVNTGEAFIWISFVNGSFELARNWIRPNGFAVSQLGWSSDMIEPIRKGLLIPQILFLPPLFIAIFFNYAGMALDSPPQMQLFHNSIGRLSFIIGTTGLGLNLLGVFRPRNWSQSLNRRLSFFAFPPITVAFLIPPLLAAFGFYLTGILLAYEMLRTVMLAVLVLIIGSLLFRWLQAGRHRLRKQAAAPDQSSSVLLRVRPEDVALAETRTRQLTRFSLILLIGIGLVTIWSDALPTLQILKRVQVWPTVTLIESTEVTPIVSTTKLATIS